MRACWTCWRREIRRALKRMKEQQVLFNLRPCASRPMERSGGDDWNPLSLSQRREATAVAEILYLSTNGEDWAVEILYLSTNGEDTSAAKKKSLSRPKEKARVRAAAQMVGRRKEEGARDVAYRRVRWRNRL